MTLIKDILSGIGLVAVVIGTIAALMLYVVHAIYMDITKPQRKTEVIDQGALALWKLFWIMMAAVLVLAAVGLVCIVRL